uniref:type II secretion system protein n=1 Tax=Candidatus Scatousia sp. TaxID=3085663 RepID=UPI004024D85A
VLRGGGRLSFLSGQGFTGGSDPESGYPELVSGSKETDVAEIAENRFRTKFGMTIFPRPLRERVRVRGKDNDPLPLGEGGRSPGLKSAFTLAEVLITLGIIGIVAAMTLPALVQNYQKMVVKNQFKKVYATLQSAIRKAEADLDYKPECYYWNKNPYGAAKCVEYKANGDCAKNELQNGGALPSDYNGKFADCSTLKSIMEKNLKVVKKCTSNAFKQNCIPDYKGIDTVLKDEQNGEIDDFELNKQTSGCRGWRENNIKTSKEVWNLADGTIILFYEGFQLFAVDVNGMKGPNKWGHDLFAFSLKSSFSLPLKLVDGGCAKIEKGGVTTGTMLKSMYAKN